MGVDLHYFMDGIAALPPVVHLLIQKAEAGIRFTFGKALEQGSKVHEAAESLQMISRAFPSSRQAGSQSNRLTR